METISLGEIDSRDKRTTAGNEEARRGHRKRDYGETDNQTGHDRGYDNEQRSYRRNRDGDSRARL